MMALTSALARALLRNGDGDPFSWAKLPDRCSDPNDNSSDLGPSSSKHCQESSERGSRTKVASGPKASAALPDTRSLTRSPTSSARQPELSRLLGSPARRPSMSERVATSDVSISSSWQSWLTQADTSATAGRSFRSSSKLTEFGRETTLPSPLRTASRMSSPELARRCRSSIPRTLRRASMV